LNAMPPTPSRLTSGGPAQTDGTDNDKARTTDDANQVNFLMGSLLKFCARLLQKTGSFAPTD
jgi:hypothetical protein